MGATRGRLSGAERYEPTEKQKKGKKTNRKSVKTRVKSSPHRGLGTVVRRKRTGVEGQGRGARRGENRVTTVYIDVIVF